MQSIPSNNSASSQGLKQIKVDNWGTFFLQRLLQLYFNEELLDLSIKFRSNDNVLKVHRLVITTCTDYFLRLEREQNEDSSTNNNVILMPLDMPYESVKSIISFMYTGQLEYWASEQNALYRTAQKMNMTILTKLLDAQVVTSGSESVSVQKHTNETFVPGPKQSVANKDTPMKVSTQISSDTPAPVWKRKLDNHSTTIITKPTTDIYNSHIGQKCRIETTGGPSRFDLPEVEDLTLGVFSSFDDITYNTKPIIQAPEKLSQTANARTPTDTTSDIFVTFNDDDCTKTHNQKDDSSDEDWTGQDTIMKYDGVHNSPVKKVRFDIDEKENDNKSANKYSIASDGIESVDNHAKIIREVLKKYPHLVQRNKNIRLKIMQKEMKSNELATPSKTKVSYVILKSDFLMTNSADKMDLTKSISEHHLTNNETGPWKCTKCNLDEQYTNYAMYRRHMQDVHNERFDPRICEHCGYKATKRNILMYHMYTKHNVAPPKSMSFPKCQVCSYIALSESLLIRHQINHKHQPPSSVQNIASDSINCTQCDKSFNDLTELACHEISSGHGISLSDKEKGHYCIHCGKHFVRLTNLKVHVDCHHRNVKKPEYILPTPLEPSSEAESLSNVSSGIAASLNVGNDLQTSEIDQTQLEKLQEHSISTSDVDINDQQMVMLINDEGYEQRNPYRNEYSMNDASNNQIILQNSDDNVVVYIENTRNNDIPQEYGTDTMYVNYQYPHGSDEIVEEVVEEFESIEDSGKDDQEQETIDPKESNKDNKEQRHFEQFFTTRSSNNNNATEVEEVIQYVEEETEILEYETCTNG